jgi:hypothetical protein
MRKFRGNRHSVASLRRRFEFRRQGLRFRRPDGARRSLDGVGVNRKSSTKARKLLNSPLSRRVYAKVDNR